MSAELDLRPDHHRHAVSFIDWARRDFLAEILWRSLFATSINSDLAVLEFFVPLSVGGASVILRTVIDSAPALAEVNLFNTDPSAMHKSLRAGALPPNVRMVHLAGEMLHRQLALTFFSRTQDQHLRNLYGLSLTITYSAWITLRREDGLAAHVGNPISNTRIYVLDGDGQPLPTGVAGELYIGRVGPSRGSFNRSELRAEHFLPDPFASEPGSRMYRTVDLARWLRHRILESTGRVDVQVKIRGLRHELGEI